jgi:small subunit ribosomal protein S17
MSDTATTTPEVASVAPDVKTRGLRKTRSGEVVSDKMDKTIVVKAITRVPHPKFGKIVKQLTKFHVHDEKNEAKIGDRVSIAETRPLSRLKRWRVVSVVQKAVTTDAVALSETDVAAQVPTKTTKANEVAAPAPTA